MSQRVETSALPESFPPDLWSAPSRVQHPDSPPATFTNPLLPEGQDPWFTKIGNEYFYSHTDRPLGWTPIRVRRSPTITGMRTAEAVPVYYPPKSGDGSRDIWAPELHFINNKPYIYFAGWSGVQGESHKMYVLEGKTETPEDGFDLAGELDPAPGIWGIDFTTFETNGQRYGLWSGKDKETYDVGTQMLYIAPMSDPVTLEAEGVCISKPTLPWEGTNLHPVNEGPQVLQRSSVTTVVFSAGHALTDDYCFGMLVNESGDFLNPDAWRKHPEPVFCKTTTVFGPGHPSFVMSPDDTEDWMISHSAQYSGSGFNRKVNAQKFTWNEDGTPFFGRPVSPSEQIPLPSGEVLLLARQMAEGIVGD